MNTTYEMLDGFRDAVQGMVVGKGINFDDAVFYGMAAMTDREICTLCDEARHCARRTTGSEMEDWQRVAGMCNTVLNTRHANRIGASYDALVDAGWHGKGIQL